jgi:hypothetical protein
MIAGDDRSASPEPKEAGAIDDLWLADALEENL